jgi:hypothetical protein
MINNTNILINRKKEKASQGCQVVYKRKNLTSLLLRDVESLSAEERTCLRDYYGRYGREAFEKIAVDNKIVPFAAHVLIALDCDISFWQEKHNFFVQRNQKIKAILNSIFAAMENFDCKSLLLIENFAVVLASKLCIGCFCSGDVDLSADIAERYKIIDCLRGFNFIGKEQPESIGEYSGQSMQFGNCDIIEGGFWINVAWKPVTRAFLIQDRYENRLAKDRLLARLISDTNIRVLDDTALMYFCALHIAAGHYYTMSPGLRLYVDIDRLARACNINWDHIVKWEMEDNAGIRISTVMYLSHKLLKTPVPEKVYNKTFKNKRNIKLVNYLYSTNSDEIQNSSSKLRRLYIELASDDGNIVSSFVSRIMQLMRSKL